MFTTQMKELTDDVLHPERTHETEDQARHYASQRSFEKRCEIAVKSPTGKILSVYTEGAIKA
jgi:hypothetical protein